MSSPPQLKNRQRLSSLLLAGVGVLLNIGNGCSSNTKTPTKPLPPPVLSGPHIAFSSSGPSGRGIKILDQLTGQVVQISPQGAFETDPAISPDGSRIAFARYEVVGEYYHIMSMAADGTYRAEVTNDSTTSDIGPHWSPDGKRIVFTRTAKGSQPWDVFTIGAGGDSIRRVTFDGKSQALDWSPDGSRLLILQNLRHLVSVAPDGSAAHTFPESTGVMIAGADYSPSGNSIALSDVASTGSRLEVMDAIGANRRVLPDTTSIVSITRCSWSPDGLAIAFSAARSSMERPRLMVLRIGDAGSQSLFSDPGDYDSPDWGPKP